MYIIKPTSVLKFAIVAMFIGMGICNIAQSQEQSDEPKPFSGLVIKPEKAQPFELVATIMQIHTGDNPRIVVAEKNILITTYEFAGQVRRTQLIGGNGEVITNKDLKTGQRVVVSGLKLDDGTIVGERILLKAKKK